MRPTMNFAATRRFRFLKDYPRLIITRTFSKAMGMAGLRVGYLLAHPDLAAQISKAKLPYNVNQFSLTAAEVALENIDRFRPAIEAVLKERERLGRELGRIPGIEGISIGSQFLPRRGSGCAASCFSMICTVRES